MTSTIKYSLRRVINWYYGNFCTRKCFNKEGRIWDCFNKFELLKSQNKELMITHKEFKDMIDNDDIKICILPVNFRKRTVGWKQMESWHRNPNFDPDKFD